MDPRKQLRRYIAETFLFTTDDSSLVDSESLMQRGIIDSTGALEVVLFLEETFGIKVEEDEMVPENLDSIDRLLGFLERKRASAA
jgi:acyl carrier protein